MTTIVVRNNWIRRIACPSYGNAHRFLPGYRNPCRTFAEVSYALLCTVLHFATDVTAKNNVNSRTWGWTTNQGVVGSSPAGRAIFQRLGTQNQVLLPPVGPLWDLLSTGPRAVVTIQALGVNNQVLLPLPWDSVGLSSTRPHWPLAIRNSVRVPLRSTIRFACFSRRPTSALA
jgi:hypothetical protein